MIASQTLSNLGFTVALVDPNGAILEQSASFISFFQKRKPLSTLEDLTKGIIPQIHKKLQKHQFFSETVELLFRKNQKKWIRFNFHPSNQQKDCFELLVDDITEQKIKYDLALEAKTIARVGSWRVNLLDNKVIWSQVTKEIHEVPKGFTPTLENGINYYKAGIHRENIIAAVAECIESGKPFDLELIVVTAKGNEKWVRSMGKAERINGETVSFSGTFQDIDHLKRERLAHESLSERLRIGINSANVGVWDFDILNNTLFWDKKMYGLYGVDESDFNGVYDAWERTIHPEDKERAAKEVTQAINGEKEFNTEFRIIKKNGSIAYIHAEAKVFRDKTGKPYRLIGANTDITKIKRTDNRLRRLLNVTEKQNQRLLQFTNIVSHNLRSNSSNISMLAGMMDTDLSAGQQAEFIDMIKTSAERLDETIVQLNEIVKIQATDSGEMVPIFVKNSLEKVFESVNALLLKADAKVSIDFDENVVVQGIGPYVNSVFLNLVTNSIKYKKPDVPVEITVSAKVTKRKTIITFKDNGLGIDLKKHGSKLFGMYKTFHNNKDAKGVGLFITKNHMEAMNGSIELESAVNQGSMFHLYFSNEPT